MKETVSGRELAIPTLEGLIHPKPTMLTNEWVKFDECVGGFRENEFSLICGGTGIGKSTMIANFSKVLLEQNIKHFVMPIENGPQDYYRRVMSCFARYDFNTGEVPPLDKLELWKELFLEKMGDNLQVSEHEERLDVETLCDRLYVESQNGCKVAFIDNLNFFLEVTSAANSVIEMDRVMHKLIMLVKEIPMHVMMVCHPRKTDGGRVESEYDIKGSSTAVQEAHNVFLFNKPREKDISDRMDGIDWGCRELKFAKMRRRGFHAGKSIVFRSRGTCYTEMGYLHELRK